MLTSVLRKLGHNCQWSTLAWW